MAMPACSVPNANLAARPAPRARSAAAACRRCRRWLPWLIVFFQVSREVRQRERPLYCFLPLAVPPRSCRLRDLRLKQRAACRGCKGGRHSERAQRLRCRSIGGGSCATASKHMSCCTVRACRSRLPVSNNQLLHDVPLLTCPPPLTRVVLQVCERLRLAPEAHPDACRQRRPQGGGLQVSRPPHRHLQDVGLHLQGGRGGGGGGWVAGGVSLLPSTLQVDVMPRRSCGSGCNSTDIVLNATHACAAIPFPSITSRCCNTRTCISRLFCEAPPSTSSAASSPQSASACA